MGWLVCVLEYMFYLDMSGVAHKHNKPKYNSKYNLCDPGGTEADWEQLDITNIIRILILQDLFLDIILGCT